MECTAEPTGYSTPVVATDRSYIRSLHVRAQSHSTQGVSPSMDDSLSNRQKRRRTSPQDHAILEAAYQQNSKPDKNERTEIVRRVALGEKEVQIWFQNRRQNDRRKSRPLLPHELVPHFRNGVPAEVMQHSSHPDTSKPSEEDIPRTQLSLLEDKHQGRVHRPRVSALVNPTSSAQCSTPGGSGYLFNIGSEGTLPSSLELLDAHIKTPTGQTDVGQTDVRQPDTEAPSTTHSSGGKKRTLDEMRELMFPSMAKETKQQKTPTLHSSVVRLSMTPDGAVTVRTTNEDTPSPPKVRPQPPAVQVKTSTVLRRSQSAIGTGLAEKAAIGQLMPARAGGRLGRSRDTRTWEFFCDSGARESLSAHAETERTGSAVGAINLIRSHSQKCRSPVIVQKPMTGTGIAPVAARRKQKPKLARAQSSMARLQNVEDGHKKGHSSSILTRSPFDDSDKENWAPGTMDSINSLRRTQPNVHPHRAQEDYDARPRRLPNIAQLDEEAGEEKEQELDCVQGLLGLSQGAWQ